MHEAEFEKYLITISKMTPSVRQFPKRRTEDGYIVLSDQIFQYPEADQICFNLHRTRFNSPYREYHLHDFYEVLYVYRGICHETTPAGSYEYKAGDIRFLNTYMPHAVTIDSDDNIVINLMMKASFVRDLFFSSLPYDAATKYFFLNSLINTVSKGSSFLFSHREKTVSLMQQIIQEYVDCKPGSNYAVSCYCGLFFNELLRDYTAEHSSPLLNIDSYNAPIYAEILNYINEHLQDANLSDMALALHYTPKHLASLIKQYFHTSFSGLKNDLRMEQASALLLSTDYSIDEIAFMTGSYDRSHFNKLFKKKFNMTPSFYRKMH